MLNGGNGVFIDENAASSDVTLLLQGRNALELAIGDVNNILGELEPLKGNTKDVLEESALLLKQNLEQAISQIDESINGYKSVVEDYRARDERIKAQIAAEQAASASVGAAIGNASIDAAAQATSSAKVATEQALGSIGKFFGGKK